MCFSGQGHGGKWDTGGKKFILLAVNLSFPSAKST